MRLIYNDPNRSFGGPLDDPVSRLEHYKKTMYEELLRWSNHLPARATEGLKVSIETVARHADRCDVPA